jgi:acyl-CoA synthetase (NDP forming)
MATKTATKQLTALFSSKSIVLVGASANPRSFGFQLARKLLRDFNGSVHYVNPTEAKVFGYDTFTSITQVPDGQHLWIITAPTKEFADTLRQISKRQPLAILLLIEFSQPLQNDLRQLIANFPCPVIGPRSAGFYDSESDLDLLPLPTEMLARPPDGATGVITDNRDVAYGLLEQLSKYRCGVSRFVDLGETLGTNETDMLSFLTQDTSTRVILFGAGQISNLSKFQKAIRQAHSAQKPVIVSLFPEAITSQLGLHRRTGKTISPLTKELAEQNKLLVTPSWGRAVDLALLCQTQPLPQGPGVVAISNFGAYCVYAASALHESPLELAKLKTETTNNLKDNLPPYCRCENPVCLYTNADEVRLDVALRIILPDPNTHSIIISLLPDSPEIDPDYLYVMLQQRLKTLKTQKTIIAVIPATERDNLLIESFERLNIPVYSNSHRAVTSLQNAYHLTNLLKPKP